MASPWTERKGFDDFLMLKKEINEDFRIVLVGLSKRQLKHIPSDVLGLPRMASKRDLAEAYSAADVLFNPTKEDTYPTVNLEAESCGTPVVVYDTCGASETISNENSLIVPSTESSKVAFVARYLIRIRSEHVFAGSSHNRDRVL